jgi:hypothetical protein
MHSLTHTATTVIFKFLADRTVLPPFLEALLG